MLIFKIYLKELKMYLLFFEEEYKTNFFLIKLKLKFKNKIFNINNIFK